MSYWLWNLFGRRYWKQLNSHYSICGIQYYVEWIQRRKHGIIETRDRVVYKIYQ